MSESVLDEDAMFAALDLIERTGAKEAQLGFLHDDVPVEEMAWYAHAQYHGARVSTENHPGPVEAVEALARRLLEGGTCAWCGEKVTLGPYPGKRCKWTRNGKRWERGCFLTHHQRIPQIVEAGRLQARGPKRRR